MNPKDNRCMTPPEVAKYYGVKAHKVLRWIKSGELPAINIATDMNSRPRWAITPDGLKQFENKRQSTAPPPTPRRTKKKKDYVEYF